MKKLLAIAGLVLAGSIAMAADGPTMPTPPEAVADYYRAKEFSIDAFGGLTTSDFDNERSYLGLGINYFITEEFGASVQTSFPNAGGQFFENIAVRGIYRAIFNKNALYGYAGPQFLFKDDDWVGELGVGLERRWTRHFGTFAEVGILKELTGDSRNAAASGRVGVRWAW